MVVGDFLSTTTPAFFRVVVELYLYYIIFPHRVHFTGTEGNRFYSKQGLYSVADKGEDSNSRHYGQVIPVCLNV